MADVAPVVFKKRIVKSSATRKRQATPPEPTASTSAAATAATHDASSDSDSSSGSDDEPGARVKRRRKGNAGSSIVASGTTHRPAEELSKSIAFTGDRSTTISTTDDATRVSNWFDADAADPAKKALRGQDPKATGDRDTALGGDTYTGTSKYTDFIKKNPDAQTRSLGPMKGPTNVRTLTITDFAPDVCKDYKQTGFCGFGDSCKFLHAREDYKQGWQLDKDWEKAQKDGGATGAAKSGYGSAAATGAADGADPGTKDIPFACIICTKPYTNPVVTKCGHYFCRECAMNRYRSKGGTTCAACKADTGGNFTVARNLVRQLERKKERMAVSEA